MSAKGLSGSNLLPALFEKCGLKNTHQSVKPMNNLANEKNAASWELGIETGAMFGKRMKLESTKKAEKKMVISAEGGKGHLRLNKEEKSPMALK
ncbi:hypothetical protein ACMFMF_005826 [Clarireedia jacksonii]